MNTLKGWYRFLPFCIWCVTQHSSLLAEHRLPVVDEREFVGNVAGAVLDAASGRGIAGATVIVTEKPGRLRSDPRNYLRHWLPSSGELRRATDASGRFLINRVPTPYPYKAYTIVASAPGYDPQALDSVPVFPGAVMTLECEFKLTKGGGGALMFHQDQPEAPYHYSHERKLRISRYASEEAVPSPARWTFATREGLVGRTTANGHVIREGDRFVSLPSTRALSRDGERDFEVRITYQGRSVIAPVWDVGPWNIRDDYWNPSSQREMWSDLPQGLPQAQAAFQQGYNSGRDEFGRPVLNPAGIDLADGTFWNDLGMRDNDWIVVEYLWSEGDVSSSPPPREPPPEDTAETPRDSGEPQPQESRRRTSGRRRAILGHILRAAGVVFGRR